MLKIPERQEVVVNASLFKRLVAFVFDLLVIDLFILAPFKSLMMQTIPPQGFTATYLFLSSNSQAASLLSVLLVIISILALAYFVVLEKMLGQTPGKMLVNIYVVSENPSAWRYLLRSLFIVPIIPLVFLWVVDPVYIFFNEEHQRLTETLSRTKVVEKVYW